MAVIINGSNTPTAGGIIYGDGSEYDVTAAGASGGVFYSAGASAPAFTAAGTSGQVLRSNGASAPTWTTVSSGLTLGTPVATTSGTSIDFTGIPAGVKQVIISFDGVSTSGIDPKLIRLGDSGGVETTSYYAIGSSIQGATAASQSNSTGFIIRSLLADQRLHGSLTLTLENSTSFTWVMAGILCSAQSDDFSFISSGRKSLSAELTTVRLTTTGGTDTFDLGEVNIAYA